MESIKVTSKIEKTIDDSLESSSVVRNSFSSKTALSAGETVGWVADYCNVNSWILNTTTGPAFSQDLISVLDSGVTASNITFIHVQCVKRVLLATDSSDPVQFDIRWTDGASELNLGSHSQFQLANSTIANLTALTISNIAAVETDSEAILTVIIGYNK